VFGWTVTITRPTIGGASCEAQQAEKRLAELSLFLASTVTNENGQTFIQHRPESWRILAILLSN